MKFSEVSDIRLRSCDDRLRSIMYRAIQITKVDFGIAEGHRSIAKQQELFNHVPKLTEKDGINKLSNHNYIPSRAVDIYGWVNGKMDYSVPVMCYLAGVIESVSVELGYSIRWGGNWDRDGEIITDQSFRDLPHYELT
jgi:peptidoglycan L-alanyl-D-glutamate endopeptidase CwlK